MAVAALAITGTALATHPRPGGGTPVRLPLVPAFKECTAPNGTHVAPLAYGTCNGPELESAVLTTNSSGANSGLVRIDVICTDGNAPPCSAAAGDQLDDRLTFNSGDVRCAVGGVPGCTAAGSDYTGRLIAQLTIRITDHASGGVCSSTSGMPPCVPATVRDITFSAPAQCADNGGANGASCVLSTSFDALEPNAIRELQRQVIEVPQVRITDAGPDGAINPTPADDPLGLGCPPICGNGDETLYQRMGFFNP